jgi:hypothetical protein
MFSYEEILKGFNQTSSNFEKSPRVKKYKKVGFWANNNKSFGSFGIFVDDDNSTDFPIQNSAKEDNSNLVDVLTKIQNKAHVESYFGCSTCRICGEDNGCLEYAYDKFIWPEGYIHYIKDHHVEIDKEFKDFLQTNL